MILASFHGMPKEYVEKGDPYRHHCVETARLLRERLGLDESRLMLTFQSRFGSAEWLKPYTDETVKGLAQRGVKKLAVITPGFAADCLETLEEIAVENADIFNQNGGAEFAAIPCLNDSDGRHGRHPSPGHARAPGLGLSNFAEFRTVFEPRPSSRDQWNRGLSLEGRR